ncbi:hypothetical protein QR46_3523 [Giardia duodenalis assemblage B]|uniref:Heat shock factor binding protein n=2 Tax=Giardia intestinalis TaxID=5741 RepID=V6TEH7_GIAIN|nr:Hypothetical protein DHA2_152964 [Giardia intestinalis]ESU43869.1 Hypothetical protein GSB_151373 [Giardia intestinalis]KWX12505.1 hypothetical protein QR46_3523 [Giardia intestinalis assemblage B]
MSTPENPEQLAESIQTLLLNIKHQQEQATVRVSSALDDILSRIDALDQNISHLLETVSTDGK